IHVPSLRARRDDISDLVRHFLQHFNRRMGKNVESIAPASLELLTRYNWPGNVRELENLLERAMIVGDGKVLEIDPSWLASPTPVAGPTSLRDHEVQVILDALKQARGKIYGNDGAAARLGLKPTTLYGKMRKLGIPRHDAE